MEGADPYYQIIEKINYSKNKISKFFIKEVFEQVNNVRIGQRLSNIKWFLLKN